MIWHKFIIVLYTVFYQENVIICDMYCFWNKVTMIQAKKLKSCKMVKDEAWMMNDGGSMMNDVV